MNLFRRRQAPPVEPTMLAQIADLQARVAAAESRVRTCETEQAQMHDEVRKWMRRAEAAERRVEARNQEPVAATAAVTPVSRLPFGARGRRMLRAMRAASETEEHVNGADS